MLLAFAIWLAAVVGLNVMFCNALEGRDDSEGKKLHQRAKRTYLALLPCVTPFAQSRNVSVGDFAFPLDAEVNGKSILIVF